MKRLVTHLIKFGNKTPESTSYVEEKRNLSKQWPTQPIPSISVAPEHARARKMPVRSQFLMIEHARCSNFHFWACSSPLDARFFHTRCNTAFENRQILAKIVHFWSNTRAKARSCRIFQCSSMLEPEFWFSSMLEPAQYSNIYFRACSSPLDAQLFHTRCNTIKL